MLAFLARISLLALVLINPALATSEPAAAAKPKAMTIIFEPPKGQEAAFLKEFVPSQAAYMQAYAGRSDSGVKVINLVPTEEGEPLIHLMIYPDASTFEKAKQIFASRDTMKNYIDGHVKRYGGYQISPEYLRNTKVYMSDVVASEP